MTAVGAPAMLRELARRLPPPPLSAVPFPVQKAILERALGMAFRAPLARGQLAFLQGRRLRVTVTDFGLCWDITCEPAGLCVRRPGVRADVELRARLHAFALLATRQADPDTLFFQRRLSIAGDTELGLECKNLMDSLEPETWHPLAPAVLEVAGRLASRLRDVDS